MAVYLNAANIVTRMGIDEVEVQLEMRVESRIKKTGTKVKMGVWHGISGLTGDAKDLALALSS